MAELERAATDADEAAVRLIADERSVNPQSFKLRAFGTFAKQKLQALGGAAPKRPATMRAPDLFNPAAPEPKGHVRTNERYED
jgi:hypothetical protein